jgi:hypothetical protein
MSTSPEATPAAQPINKPPKDNPPLDLLRNKLAFGGDSMLWGFGIAFMPVGTVLTSLAAKLTDDKALVGTLSLTWYVAYLLPHLFAARLVHGKQRTKPYSVWPSLIGRPVILLYALWLVFTRAQDPQLTMWLLLGAIAIFLGFYALTSTAWFDMVGRAFTPAGPMPKTALLKSTAQCMLARSARWLGWVRSCPWWAAC